MAYVQKSNATAPRSSYAGNKPATASNSSAPKAPGANKPSHNLSIMVKDGEAVEFINLTGLFAGETKDGRAMYKGKPKEALFIRLPDGREVSIDGFLVTAKDK